ncbi:hypothetical protein HanIR_Chr03g0133771 [Helianthus annuus]|nr:hypothetical protein HanIR_Chr03g0133771 [Helianthus annuus]
MMQKQELEAPPPCFLCINFALKLQFLYTCSQNSSLNVGFLTTWDER